MARKRHTQADYQQRQRQRRSFPTDQLADYFRDTHQLRFLSAADEVELSHVILDPVTTDAVRRAARDCLVCGNLRLVVLIARRYQGRGMDLCDLVAEGNLGLFRAARDYDGRCRFCTYASWWIRNTIVRALEDQSRTIRLPSYVQEALRGVGRRRISEKTRRAAACCEGVGRLSIDISAPESSPEEAAEQADCWAVVAVALAGLDPRRREVLTLRFGLDGGEPMTLLDIGLRLGVTRSRAQQLEQDSLARLRVALAAHSGSPN